MSDLNSVYANIGEQLKAVRLARGLTMTQAAAAVDDENYRSIERGKRKASIAKLQNYANVLGVKLVIELGPPKTLDVMPPPEKEEEASPFNW